MTCGIAALPAAFTAQASRAPFDVVVGRDAPNLQAAVDLAPADGARAFRVLLPKGVHRERVVVTKPFVEITGESRTETRLTFDAAAGHLGPDGHKLSTRGCATLIVRAPRFTARTLTIANDFDYVGNLLKAESDPTRLNDPQGVALMLDAGSDRAAIEDAELIGHQDTLFIDAGLSRFRRCRITGSVDFVFGAGRSLIETSAIVSRFRRGKPRQGYVAAPSTLRTQPFGLVFHHCRLTKEADVPASSVVLGRPWRPSRDFADGKYGDPDVAGHAAFLQCWMEDHISADGWDAMGYTAPSGERVMLQPGEARLFEYGSKGPGARDGAGRRKLTHEEAVQTREGVLDGWK